MTRCVVPFNGILPSHANLVGLQKQMTQGETTMYYILDDDTKGEEGIKKGACKFGRRRRRMGVRIEGFKFLHR